MTQPKAVVKPPYKCKPKQLKRRQQQAASNEKRLLEYQQWADDHRSPTLIIPYKRRHRRRIARPLEIKPDSAYGKQIERLERFAKQFSQAHKPAIKLKLLREMAELKYSTVKAKLQPLIRQEFDQNKHKWLKLKGVCAVCMNQPNVRHHIVQIQNGGLNNRKNLMLLCNPCHAEIHPWLK